MLQIIIRGCTYAVVKNPNLYLSFFCNVIIKFKSHLTLLAHANTTISQSSSYRHTIQFCLIDVTQFVLYDWSYKQAQTLQIALSCYEARCSVLHLMSSAIITRCWLFFFPPGQNLLDNVTHRAMFLNSSFCGLLLFISWNVSPFLCYVRIPFMQR